MPVFRPNQHIASQSQRTIAAYVWYLETKLWHATYLNGSHSEAQSLVFEVGRSTTKHVKRRPISASSKLSEKQKPSTAMGYTYASSSPCALFKQEAVVCSQQLCPHWLEKRPRRWGQSSRRLVSSILRETQRTQQIASGEFLQNLYECTSVCVQILCAYDGFRFGWDLTLLFQDGHTDRWQVHLDHLEAFGYLLILHLPRDKPVPTDLQSFRMLLKKRLGKYISSWP